MPAISDPWRPVRVSIWTWLEDCDPLAQRLWLWLATGPESSATGLIRMRLYRATGALRTKQAALIAALDDLEDRGHLVTGPRNDRDVTLYLTPWLTSQCAVKAADRRAMLAVIQAVSDGAAKSQALEDWTIWDRACQKADPQPAGSLPPASRQQEQEQEQEQEKIRAGAARASARPKTRAVAQAQPTEAETKAIFAELGIPDGRAGAIAAKCFAYWQSNGFRRKNGPIRDWRATCRTWALNEADRDPQLRAAMDARGMAAPVLDPAEDWDPETDPASERSVLWNRYADALGFRAMVHATQHGYPTLVQLRQWAAKVET